MTRSIMIISGAGAYADPWHPFAETSAALADVLRGPGRDIVVRDDVETALSESGDVDLLVLNVGMPRPAADWVPTAADLASQRASRAGLLAHVANERPILAMHTSATTFGHIPEWESILGGTWVRGTTMHPPRGEALIHVKPTEHPVTAGMTDFVTHDERYSYLRVAPTSTVLADHEHAEARHPLVWTTEVSGARVVYDALGHDAQAYESADARRLVSQAAEWLLS